VADVTTLQATALADLRETADLDEEERAEQFELIDGDDTGASALRWLIKPADVIGLVGHVEEVEPVEATLGVEPSDGELDTEPDAEL
jgi:hypothetical protein